MIIRFRIALPHDGGMIFLQTTEEADDPKTLIVRVLGVCYEKIFGIWGSSLLGTMYRKVNWTQDTDYVNSRREYIRQQFNTWLGVRELDRPTHFALAVAPAKLPLVLKALQFIHNLEMPITATLRAKFIGRPSLAANHNRRTRSGVLAESTEIADS